MGAQLQQLRDRDLAAVATNALAELAHRRRNRPDFEVYDHVRSGAAMIETLVMSHIPAQPLKVGEGW